MFDAYFDILGRRRVRELVTNRIARLLNEASPDSPNWVVTLILPYAEWGWRAQPDGVTGWARATSKVPYREDFGQGVVDTLLQIAFDDFLAPHIPVNIWGWLKKCPSLPPRCRGRLEGSRGRVVRRVRELGDPELLVSYFLLFWSGRDQIDWDGRSEMCASIGEDLGGIGTGRHREVLTKCLDHILGEWDRELENHSQQPHYNGELPFWGEKEQYEKFKGLLLEADREASKLLTRTPLRLINSFDLLTQRTSTESHSTFNCALPPPCP